MRILFLIALLFIPVTAQAPLKPISFSLAVKTNGDDRFERTLWYELRQNRNIIVSARKPDFDIYATATELTEGNQSYGYAAAVLVVVDGRYDLSIHSGRGPVELGRFIARELDRKYFQGGKR